MMFLLADGVSLPFRLEKSGGCGEINLTEPDNAVDKGDSEKEESRMTFRFLVYTVRYIMILLT